MNTTSPGLLLIAGIYYLLAAVLVFFALFGVYILIRYGKSTPLALSISLVFAFLFLKILAESHQTLSLILS